MRRISLTGIQKQMGNPDFKLKPGFPICFWIPVRDLRISNFFMFPNMKLDRSKPQKQKTLLSIIALERTLLGTSQNHEYLNNWPVGRPGRPGARLQKGSPEVRSTKSKNRSRNSCFYIENSLSLKDHMFNQKIGFAICFWSQSEIFTLADFIDFSI